MSPFKKFEPPQSWSGDKFFTNADGKKVRYGFSHPEGDSKGTIVLTTGYGCFLEKYLETARLFNTLGYAVWMMDWPNQGRSERYDPARPLKPLSQYVDRYVRDLEYFRTHIVEQEEDKPTYLVAHSKGGSIALHHAKHHPGSFDAAILSSPMFEINTKIPKWIARKAVDVLHALGFEDRHLSKIFYKSKNHGKKSLTERILQVRSSLRGPQPVRMQLNSLVHALDKTLRIGDPTVGWARETYNYNLPLLNDALFLQSVDIPILIGSQNADDLVDAQAHRRIAGLLPNAELFISEGRDHNLWEEDEQHRLAWWEAVVRFLDKQDVLYREKHALTEGPDDLRAYLRNITEPSASKTPAPPVSRPKLPEIA